LDEILILWHWNVEIYLGIDLSISSIHIFIFVYLELYISRSLELILWCVHYTDGSDLVEWCEVRLLKLSLRQVLSVGYFSLGCCYYMRYVVWLIAGCCLFLLDRWSYCSLRWVRDVLLIMVMLRWQKVFCVGMFCSVCTVSVLVVSRAAVSALLRSWLLLR
jgi:hypothetical protein